MVRIRNLARVILGQSPAGVILGAFFWATATVAPAQIPAQPAAGELILLVEGIARSSDPQRSGDSLVYEFDADGGENYLVRVDQNGLDFSVRLLSPDGAERTFNTPLFRDEADFVLVDGAAAGRHRILVGSDEPTNAVGSHTITVRRLSGETSDERVVNAWRLMTEAAAANAEGSFESAQRALDDYLSAADLWRDIGETRLEAQAILSAGMLQYWTLEDWSGAVELAKRAADIYSQLNEPKLYANSLFLSGYSLIDVADNPDTPDRQAALTQAIETLTASRDIYDRLGHLYERALVTNDIGLAYQQSGDFSRAQQYWQEAEPIFAGLGEWWWSIAARHNLALISIDSGYALDAVATLEGVLDELPNLDDRFAEGSNLMTLGAAYREAGNFDAALESYSRALEIHRSLGRRNGEAYALRGIGSAYFALGELDLSETYLGEARDLSTEIKDARILAFSLAYLGNIAYLRGQYDDALGLHERAVELTTSPPDRADREIFVVRDLIALGRFDESLTRANEVFDAATELGTEDSRAAALLELGRGHLGAGRPEEANRHFSSALELYDALGLANGQAEALHGLAQVAEQQGTLSSAIDFGAEALQRFETQRQRVVAPELRAFYSAARRLYYETQIRLLMADYEQGRQPERLLEALSVSERSRARLTIDLLAEAAVDLKQGMPEDLLDRQQMLYEELRAQRVQRDRLLDGGALDDFGRARLESHRLAMGEIENELNLLELRFRRSRPEYARFTSSAVLGAEQIQHALSGDSVLLQYELGERESFVWVVTRDSVSAVELADRETIEHTARDAFERLQTYQSSAFARRERDRALDELSNLVLEPIIDLLGNEKRRLVVVVDGALQYVPFAILPVQVNGMRVPLVEIREVVGLPSVSAWQVQNERAQSGLRRNSLAVFADPVFDASDSRLAGAERALTLADSNAENGSGLAYAAANQELVRLPATAAEAQQIAALVPADARLVASGFDANVDTVLAGNLSEYNFVHFATHGLIDSRYPALSALALSQFDAHGDARQGFLRLGDIYNLELNAELVVLSACETALGRAIRGEGLIGLTQGFLYAGARSLVVSLWQVPDRGTQELMTRLYRGMLHDGLDAAAALRQAQRSMAQNPRWRDPYFWGAFVVIGGEDSQAALPAEPSQAPERVDVISAPKNKGERA